MRWPARNYARSPPAAKRLERGAVLQQRALPYVEAARSLGVPQRRVRFLHLVPNVLPLAVAVAFVSFSVGLVALSSLSFLSVGVAPGTPDWGGMLMGNRLLLQAGAAALSGPAVPIDSVRLLPPLSPPTVRDFVALEEHVEGVVKSVTGGAGVPPEWH